VTVAYLDSSWWIAVAFGEGDTRAYMDRVSEFSEIFSSNLLEAEVGAAFQREGVRFERAHLRSLSWVLPNRPLSEEIERVLAVGYLRGADL
jgi:hypothetical protein